MVGERERKDSGSRKVPWMDEGTSRSDRTDQKQTLGARWKPRSRQEEGRKSEKKIAKDIGARVHPNSGSLRIKHDASDAETLYEIKDANKSFTLKAVDLDTLWVRAVREQKEPVFIVKFQDRSVTATISITKEV